VELRNRYLRVEGQKHTRLLLHQQHQKQCNLIQEFLTRKFLSLVVAVAVVTIVLVVAVGVEQADIEI
jgi:hypothetical protein